MSGIFQDAVFGGLFGDPEAMALWSAEAQLERFRTVEAALSKALAEVGLVAQELVDKAWEIIERVESEGGMAKAVSAGWPKAMIEEAAAGRQARVDRAEDVIVGVNKYRLASEDHLDTLDIDNDKVRQGQIAQVLRHDVDIKGSGFAGHAQVLLEVCGRTQPKW